MTRPSFQFYPADWQANANLRRCTRAEKSVWLDVMCLMHDSEEYGILRWTLKDISVAASCKVSELRALVTKGVLKGADDGQQCEPYVYVPRSGRKNGTPVTLIAAQPGPLWYSSRMVRDEYVRRNAGAATRFQGNQAEDEGAEHSPRHSPSRRHGDPQNAANGGQMHPKNERVSLQIARTRPEGDFDQEYRLDNELDNSPPSPSHWHGDDQSDGSSSSSSSSESNIYSSPGGSGQQSFDEWSSEAEPTPRGTSVDMLAEFERWWKIYPGRTGRDGKAKKAGKAAALNEFRKARKLASLKTLLDGAREYARTEDHRYVVDPERWLKRSKWADETMETPAASKQTTTNWQL